MTASTYRLGIASSGCMASDEGHRHDVSTDAADARRRISAPALGEPTTNTIIRFISPGRPSYGR